MLGYGMFMVYRLSLNQALVNKRKTKIMVPSQDKKENRIAGDVRKKAETGENSETEQTRIENRREADLEDKTPAGDAGVEDNRDDKRADDPIGESNY